MKGASCYLRAGPPPAAMMRLKASDLPPDIETAYAGLASLTAQTPERWAAWKLGTANNGSRTAFRTEEICYGAIAGEELLKSPHHAPMGQLPELKGEVEVALRIGPDGTGWDAWAVALEMPASPIENLIDLGLVALVADRCAAGALLIGKERVGPVPDASAHFQQVIDGAIVCEGGLSELVGTPEELLGEFLSLAREHEAPVMPGHWVATGGLTPCVAYKPGQRVEVRLDEKTALDFIVAQSAS